ncbi:MAG: ion transporter [Saprospiraceae bacterium]|nr:ion transporter [Saprospiraceae bacterium]
MNVFFKKIVDSQGFNFTVAFIILINCILIGVEQSYQSQLISWIQDLCIVLFIAEIIFRWLARASVISFFKNIWNIIDLMLILVSLIPESLFENAELLTIFRIVRVIRIIRLIKVFPETLAILRVVKNSFGALLRIISLLIILMYFYALVGVILFKGKTHVSNKFNDTFDPFGNISEALFSLFRVTTGEDWTDLRYDLLSSDVSNWIVNIYFVSWLILSAFFLLNIIIGAVVKNYDSEYSQDKNAKQDEEIKQLKIEINKLKNDEYEM